MPRGKGKRAPPRPEATDLLACGAVMDLARDSRALSMRVFMLRAPSEALPPSWPDVLAIIEKENPHE